MKLSEVVGNGLMTKNNEKKKDCIGRMLEQVFKEALIHGFYGQVGFFVKIQDGSIQKIEKHIQQDFISGT